MLFNFASLRICLCWSFVQENLGPLSCANLSCTWKVSNKSLQEYRCKELMIFPRSLDLPCVLSDMSKFLPMIHSQSFGSDFNMICHRCLRSVAYDRCRWARKQPQFNYSRSSISFNLIYMILFPYRINAP